jgi:hypothetical protein
MNLIRILIVIFNYYLVRFHGEDILFVKGGGLVCWVTLTTAHFSSSCIFMISMTL